jgi:cobalamin biosynthesis Mg chelatase CobN
MLVEVKKCADMNDIKGLRYIFIDSLDVDPTFEKYEQDYNYCKGLSGFFEEYTEITIMKQNPSDWNASYWDQLKRDLVKNFSQIRFEHMIKVAKVVYSEKIERLVSERAAKKAKIESQIESVIPSVDNIENTVNPQERTVISENVEPQMSNNTQREIEESQRAYEESERKKAEIARKRAEAERMQKAEEEKEQPKKWVGIALIVAVIVIIAVILIIAL